MAWYIDSTRIFIQDWKENENQIVPRLQPLASGTVLQVFGYENPIVRVTGIVVGITDKDTIKAMTTDGLTHTLSGPYSMSDAYYVKSVTAGLQPAACQTLRQDLPEDSPVYNVDMELYK